MIRVLLLALVFGALAAARPAVAAPDRPNLIFILVDDMGYADLGCMGGTDIKTPNIDRLAAEGLKFSDFYSNAPVCSPTRCGFITGRWQQRVGFEWALGFTAEQSVLKDGKWVDEPDKLAIGLPTSETSIARMLKDAGYATGCFGKWHLGYQPQFSPLRHGFDEYYGVLLGHSDYYYHQYFDGTWCLFDGSKKCEDKGYVTDLINAHAAEFIRKHANEPFFMYVPHLAVHAPFQPPDEELPMVTKENMYDGTRAGYARMLERVDKGVGMILAELEKNGIADNTLVVLSSDNGGERFSDNAPLFNKKTTLWEGGIRVPCLMRWPAKLPKGKTTSQPAITMDITATFLAIAGGHPPEGRTLDGMNLLPVLIGEQPQVERTFFWRVDRSARKQKAIRQGKWKYVNDGVVTDLLFDLENDIGERVDLGYKRPEIVKDLKARLKAWEEEMDASPRTFIVR